VAGAAAGSAIHLLRRHRLQQKEQELKEGQRELYLS
jgi:hypothetical protein